LFLLVEVPFAEPGFFFREEGFRLVVVTTFSTGISFSSTTSSRLFVIPHSLERGMTHNAIRSHLSIAYFTYERWFKPGGFRHWWVWPETGRFVNIGFLNKRAFLCFQWLELRHHLLLQFLSEARADLTRIFQLPIFFDAYKECTKELVAALIIRISANDHFLAVTGFYF
jgi:hypothetical protein